MFIRKFNDATNKWEDSYNRKSIVFVKQLLDLLVRYFEMKAWAQALCPRMIIPKISDSDLLKKAVKELGYKNVSFDYDPCCSLVVCCQDYRRIAFPEEVFYNMEEYIDKIESICPNLEEKNDQRTIF